MSVTTPNYSWNFLITGATSSTHLDTISNSTATYGTKVTSDTTDGAYISGDNGTGKHDITIPSTDFSSSFSFEFLVRINSNNNYAGMFNFKEDGNNSIKLDMNGTTLKYRFVMKSNGSSKFNSSTSGTHDGTAMTTGTYHHMVFTYNSSTQEANYYQDGTRVWYQTSSVNQNYFPITSSNVSHLGDVNGSSFACDMNMKFFRIWTNHALSNTEVQYLYTNRANYHIFADISTLLTLGYSHSEIINTLGKTLADYQAENIPIADTPFGAFTAINKLKETYIQGPVDISGDLIVRSNKNTFYDISASKIGFSSGYGSVNPKIVTNDLSLNNRFFVGGDASFNGNVTIQGDLSLGSAISYTGTIANSKVNLGDTSVKTFTHDISLNADLAIHGKTTVKNDLYLNAYTDVSANPVLSDGTYLKNMKMDKLNHQYITDISRSAPFSTLTSKTLPTDIWDSSSNSGICISADGKYIRTVNSGDLSNNATSYYSEDYGSSFHKDEALSQKFNYFDISINTATQYSSDFKFGSDKVFMSYNGQHQLVPRGISNIGTYDDYLYTSNDFGKNWNLRKSSTLRTFNYTVTANGSSNYIFNGETYTNAAQPTVNIGPNETVIFTVDTTTNGNHPFKIGTSSSGGEITDSTISSVTSGSNQVITFTPTSSGTFYYYCSFHGGMGNSITVANYNMGPFSPSTWFWNTGAVSADGKNMYVSGSAGFWKSSDYGRIWNQTSADSSFNFMSISADGKLVYGVNERKVYGSTDYGNTFSTLYTDAYTSDLSYAGISTSGNGKYITLADVSGSNIYMSSDYGNSFELKTLNTNSVVVSGEIYNWDFRVAATTSITDSIGGLTATYANGATSTVSDGISLAGGTTNGNGHHVDLQDFEIGLNYSFEVYLKFGSSVDNFERVFDFGDGHSMDNIFIGRHGTGSALNFFNLTDYTSGTSPNINGGTIVSGELTHLVGVIQSDGYLKLYQDGTLLGTSTVAAPATTKTRTNHYVGRSNYNSYSDTDGNIYYLRVYNTALTQSDVTKLYTNREAVTLNINCGISHSGKIVLNSNCISYDYGNNFTYVRDLISNQLTNNDTFYSKANLEYIIDASNNSLLQIPYKSAIFQDIYSVGSIKAGSTTYSSDYRLKENVQPLTDNETVNELHPVKYYNTNLKKNDYGLLAHELQEKYPFLVSGEKDGAEKQSINYNGLISLLVHEVKNLKKEYQELIEMKNNA